MAFDLAFDFRDNSGFVTDPAYGVAVLSEAYPHTYTNGNGDSVNGGFTDSITGATDVNASWDPRIAGTQNSDIFLKSHFQVDLSSGSAPGAGTYTVDIALGQHNAGPAAKVLDNTTLVIDLTNGGSGYAQSANHFIDATGTSIAGSASWGGTPVTGIVFGTTTAIVEFNSLLAVFNEIAHFRLTLEGGGVSTVRPHHIAYGLQRGIFLGR